MHAVLDQKLSTQGHSSKIIIGDGGGNMLKATSPVLSFSTQVVTVTTENSMH